MREKETVKIWQNIRSSKLGIWSWVYDRIEDQFEVCSTIPRIIHTILKVEFTISGVKYTILTIRSERNTIECIKRRSIQTQRSCNLKFNPRGECFKFFDLWKLHSHEFEFMHLICTILYPAYVIVQVFLAGFFILNIVWVTSHWNNSRSLVTSIVEIVFKFCTIITFFWVYIWEDLTLMQYS